MFKKLMAFTLTAAFAATGYAYAATTIVDDDFSKLDEATWRVWSASEEGALEVKDGALVITGVEGGWKQKGLALKKPIDISKGLTTIEVAYKENAFTQQPPAFCQNGEVDGEDIWNYPGFRITVGPETSDWEALSGFGGVSGYIDKGDSEAFETVAPFTLKWTLKKSDGTIYDAVAFVNGEQVSTASIDIGEFDPAAAFFYLYVSNNDGDGPTVIDSVKITQE